MNGFRSSADLFADLNRFHTLMDQVFGPTGRGSIRGAAGTAFPVLNVGSTPEAIEVQALAPGLDPAGLEVTVDRGLLVVAGERKSQMPQGPQASSPSDQRERTSVHAQERFAGRFRRVVSLPDDADPARVDASYRDGVLRITVARRESSRPRRIEVN